MKNTIKYTSLALFTLLLSACSLEETPISQIPEDEAFKSSELIYLNTVASLYSEIGADGGGNGLGGTDRGLYDLNTFTADEAILPTRGGDWYDGGLWQDLFAHKWGTSNDLVKSTWDYLYRVVGKCNQSIDKLDALIAADPSNTHLLVYKSEVQAFRAIYYYYLLDLYANVPLVKSSTATLSDIKQSSRKEVFDFVRSELETAMPYLSTSNSSKAGEYYGRITRPVAFFVMAKLALNAQVYTDNDWTDNGGIANGPQIDFVVGGTTMSCWKASIAYCDSITALGYILEPSPSGYLANFSIKNEGSKENIFVIPMDPILYKAKMMYNVRTRHYEHGKAFAGQDGWNGASATKELLATFRKGGEDPRLAMSFFLGKVQGADGTIVKNGDVDLEYVPDAIALDLSGTTNEKTAGARWAKYQYDATALSGGQNVSNDFVLFRYADVLLMKAEALVRAGEDGSAELKKVRDRVEAPYRVADLNTILDERMMELNWEGVRRQDLIRFGKYNLAINDRPASGAYRQVFPIPAKVLDLNTNLKQNIGY